MHKPQNSRKQNLFSNTGQHTVLKAFTLIELLAVIAVIAVLLAILTPALQRAKVLTRETICCSNISQQMKGQVTFATDNGMKFPPRNEMDPQYVRRGNPDDGKSCWWTALRRGGYFETASIMFCAILHEHMPHQYWTQQNQAWTAWGSYGGWESNAHHILLSYSWFAGFPAWAYGENSNSTATTDVPPRSMAKMEPFSPMVAHRMTTGAGASWDLTHDGAERLRPYADFDDFETTRQPVGFGDGHVDVHNEDEIRPRFQHNRSGYTMTYLY